MAKARSRQQIIDYAARTVLRDRLPAGWLLREQTEDYGVDVEVEIFRAASAAAPDEQSSGTLFKVQLKGTETGGGSGPPSARLDRHSAAYLARELNAPAILVIADVKARRLYWHALQLDAGVSAWLDEPEPVAARTRTITPAADCELPKSGDALLDAVARCEKLLGVRALTEGLPASFHGLLTGVKLSNAVTHLLDQTDRLKLQQIYEFIGIGKTNEAVREATAMSERTDAKVEVRYGAVLAVEQVIVKSLTTEERETQAHIYRIGCLRKARRIARQGSLRLRLHAAIAHQAAVLQIDAWRDFALYVSVKANSGREDVLWQIMVGGERRRLVRSIVKRLTRCHRILALAVTHGEHSLIANATMRIVMALTTFIIRLQQEGLSDGFREYRKLTRDLAEMGASVAAALKTWDDLIPVVATAAIIVDPSDPQDCAERLSWAEKWFARIEDVEAKKRAMTDLVRIREMLAKLRNPTNISELPYEAALEHRIRMHKEMAFGQGIDLNDQSDRIASVVRHGLADLDVYPTLKRCEHLYVLPTSWGLPGDWLQLPTAGSKRVGCALKNRWFEGWSLKSLDESFAKRVCAGCADVKPRDPSWRPSAEWDYQALRAHRADAVPKSNPPNGGS